MYEWRYVRGYTTSYEMRYKTSRKAARSRHKKGYKAGYESGHKAGCQTGLPGEVRITLRKGIQNEQRNINYTLRTGSSCTTERKSSRPNWGYLCTALHCHFPIPIPCPIPCPIPGPIPNSTTATLTTIPQRAACAFSQCDCHMNCVLPPLAHFVCSNCSRQLLEEEQDK